MSASIIRSCLVSGVAAASVAGFVVAPAAQQTLLVGPDPAVALTALVEPLAAQTPVALSGRIPALLNEQVTFHITFVADFVATGLVLADRQLQIPHTLVRDLQNGTPVPVAVGRALHTFVEIELDAGRELVGFAMQYVDFQIRFIAQVVQDVVSAATSALAAAADVITPAAAPAPPSSAVAEAVSVPLASAQVSAAAPDSVTETRKVDSSGPTMSLATSDDEATLPAEGEAGNGSYEPTTPVAEVTSDKEAPAQRDDVVDTDASDQAESADADENQSNTPSAAEDTGNADGSESEPGDE